MKKYKIVFGEFIKFKDDEEISSFEFGTTNRIYNTDLECANALFEEYSYIKNKAPYYEKVDEISIDRYEFKLKGIVHKGRKEVIHHYKMVEFTI